MSAERRRSAGAGQATRGLPRPRTPDSTDSAPPAGSSRLRLQQMQSITDSTLGYMSLEDMVSELLGRITGLLAVDTAAVLLLDEDRGVLVARAARGLEEEVRQGVQVPLARGFAGRVAAQAQPIVIEDLDRFEVVNPILRQKGIRSMLGVPVHVEGRVIGVMHVGSLKRRTFDDHDIELLQLAADRAALAIDNARLSEQRSVTEIMQRSLLPDALPQVPGLRLSAKYLPAGSGLGIGGDWYDVFQLPNGHLAFVIGDVVGRGVLAASVMAEIRTATRAYLLEGHALVDVLSLLNDLLGSMGRHRSATACILELEVETGVLECVSAGHLPPLIVGTDGESAFLGTQPGPPLGFNAEGGYVLLRTELPVGSALLLCTDGLIERRGESIDDGLERLRAAAGRASGGEDAPLADRVYRALTGNLSFEDDIALLAIESLPLGPTLELTLEAEPGVLAPLRRTLGRWLAGQGFSEEDRFGITLAVSEAAGNAIEHAYGAREGKFTVSCRREGDAVQVCVSDSGSWRESRPLGGGRGLSVMRAFTDRVEIERGAGGTTVTLSRELPAGAR